MSTEERIKMEERIQELRRRKGLSQEQLAEILGVSRQAVSKWEGGQSLPEVEKLIAMSALFDVTVDYILKGGTPQSGKRNDTRVGSLTVSSVATMLLAIAVFAVAGQISDGTHTMDIYGGLIIESVGLMLMLVGFFIGGGRILNKPLFTVNILLAGILPSSFLLQILLRYYPRPVTPLLSILLFAGAYLVLCGTVLYFAVGRKKKGNHQA